ncbi:hypothetical protein THAOC_19460, partial [Thalassiosira oceanica]
MIPKRRGPTRRTRRRPATPPPFKRSTQSSFRRRRVLRFAQSAPSHVRVHARPSSGPRVGHVRPVDLPVRVGQSVPPDEAGAATGRAELATAERQRARVQEPMAAGEGGGGASSPLFPGRPSPRASPRHPRDGRTCASGSVCLPSPPSAPGGEPEGT